MKTFSLALALLAATGCASKESAPAPTTPTPAPASTTYISPTGQQMAVASTKVYFVTATPTRLGQERRAIVVRTQLSDGSELTMSYRYIGRTFPGALGAVTLDEAIRATTTSATQVSASYEAPVTMGTLNVDGITPQVVSGTYTGPLVAGGPAVRFTFSRLPI